ncbi:hypothetical protein ACROYT_G038000 [Oculina patagonica]
MRRTLCIHLSFLLFWELVTSAQNLTGTSNPGRLSCLRYGKFEQPQKGYALVNHVIATYTMTCPLDCTMECLSDGRCQSFNCADSGDKCEINDQSKETSPNDFGPRPGFTYYGPTTQTGGTGPGCAFVTCQNGGTCFDSCWNPRMFTCACTKDYTGVYCERHVKSCLEHKSLGAGQDGIYNIDPDGQGIIRVFCDQTTDGGGWIVIQRRIAPYSGNFEKWWDRYRIGFGSLSGEFWLGNDNLHRIAPSDKVLRVDIHRTDGQKGYAKFGGFQVANAAEKFQWNMNSFEGNIPNAIYGNSDPKENIRGMKFSTPNMDNDNNPNGKCLGYAGWWANNCVMANFNARSGPVWKPWSQESSITFTEMKVREN